MQPNENPTILISGEIRPSLPDEVMEIAPGATVRCFSSVDEMAQHIEAADIVVTSDLPPSALKKAARLRWVQSWAAGPDNLMYPEMVESDVLLTCCKGNGAVPLAEHAMMLMLMLDRDAPRALAAQHQKKWDRYYHGELNGRTCGIIGMGHSGQDLALKAKAFHMNVIGMRRTLREAPNFDRVYPTSALMDFVAACDFLVVTAPLTTATKGLLGEREFRAMKPSMFYICFSRGGIADDAILLRALQENWIAGAGLDAHDEEPLPEASPFWDLPNVIITPHYGALSQGTRARGYEIFLENLRRFQSGAPLLNVVDKSLGY